MTEHIIFYGKGGVGKTSLVSNISAALTESGLKILQVGCGSGGDSCSTLNGGLPVPAVSDLLRENGHVSAANAVYSGFRNISMMEIGESENGSGYSTDEGIRRIFEVIEQEQIIDSINADYVLYDISGESSFAVYHEILGRNGANPVFIVTTADFMSLKKANCIFESLERFGESGITLSFGGLIPNCINNTFEDYFIADFAGNTLTNVLGRIPRSLVVRQCELYGKTVIEASPLSNQSYFYRKLANQIVDISLAPPLKKQPKPMPSDKMQTWAHEWADRLYALENGLVAGGEAI